MQICVDRERNLSIFYATRKFEQYMLRTMVLIQNDHKLLDTLLGKPFFEASLRLQRMMLQLQSV